MDLSAAYMFQVFRMIPFSHSSQRSKFHLVSPFFTIAFLSNVVLRLPRSLISDSIVKQTAQRLSIVTFLDLSYCHKIGAQAIEAIGKHCKHLANAIASTMPRLKQLEFAYRCISTECVLNLLSCCPQLVHLKIDEFLSEKLDHKFLKEKYPKLEI
ncbi:hypothetical protein Gotri_005270, partial [Gossypium trilobum]|nr:hypothetical protein [Gossypium trilobum]